MTLNSYLLALLLSCAADAGSWQTIPLISTIYCVQVKQASDRESSIRRSGKSNFCRKKQTGRRMLEEIRNRSSSSAAVVKSSNSSLPTTKRLADLQEELDAMTEILASCSVPCGSRQTTCTHY